MTSPDGLPHVLHVASGREWRGGQHQVVLLADGLHQQGIATSVITGHDTELARRLRDAGVHVMPVRWVLGIDPGVVWRVLRAGDSRAILHAHDSHAHAIADAVARLRGNPLAVTRRVDRPIRSGRRYRRADAVIAVSEAVRQRVIATGIATERVHRIADAVDLDAVALDAATPVRANGSPLIVCIAALTREKGIDLLLDAAHALHATHPGARWQVIGEGIERRALEAQRRRLGLDDVVDLAGAGIPAATVLRRATVAVQSSRSEGLGSAVLLALALGVPVVAAATGGLPDALAHGGGILVAPESPLELAEAVRRLLNDPERRRQLGSAGRSAAQEFSVPRLVQRTLDVYRSIAHSQGRR